MPILRSQIIVDKVNTLKRFDLTLGRHTGGTERGRGWAGGQFLSHIPTRRRLWNICS